jgi:hypothetical protein
MMGTNYYIKIDPCEKCGSSEQEYHIGKSSGGWCFSLHVDPQNNIHILEDIMRLWEKNIIKDEYGRTISPEEMLVIITKRGWHSEDKRKPFGYQSWDEFHKLNHSIRGPNNLLRHIIDGKHCVGHGDGTYDYIIGEFS